MQKHGFIGIIVLLFACTFLTVIYELAENGHFVEKVIPPTKQSLPHEGARPGKPSSIAAPSEQPSPQGATGGQGTGATEPSTGSKP